MDVWNYGSLQDKQLHSQLVPPSQVDTKDGFNSMPIRSTLCWSDTKRKGFKITDAHKACHVSLSSFLKFNNRHESIKSFVHQATSSMSLAASKSSMQSDIGALSRRSKLGAERICLSRSLCPSYMSRLGQIVIPSLT